MTTKCIICQEPSTDKSCQKCGNLQIKDFIKNTRLLTGKNQTEFGVILGYAKSGAQSIISKAEKAGFVQPEIMLLIWCINKLIKENKFETFLEAQTFLLKKIREV